MFAVGTLFGGLRLIVNGYFVTYLYTAIRLTVLLSSSPFPMINVLTMDQLTYVICIRFPSLQKFRLILHALLNLLKSEYPKLLNFSKQT